MTGCFLLLTIHDCGGGIAQARLYCLSLRCQQATAYDSYGFRWQLSLTTLPAGVNGELAPYFLTASYDHSAYVELYSEVYDSTDAGVLGLNIPASGDANGNGFADFFEVSQGANGLASSGVLQTQSFYPSPGTAFQATWNRSAGSPTGTCSFQVNDPSNPFNSIEFDIPFTLLEYTGPVAYTAGSNTVSAAVNFSQTGGAGDTLQGPILFVKSVSDPFNTLTNQPGTWTNASMAAMNFTNHIFTRQIGWPTNYAGYVQFEDGDATTADADYTFWVMSIDDTNDADGDGIPDFSDDPALALPRQPWLVLLPGMTNLLMTASGDVGHVYEVQESTNLSSINWLPVFSFELTNDPQTISLPAPSAEPKFWRVRAD